MSITPAAPPSLTASRHHITVLPGQYAVAAGPDTTVLQAALSAGVELPSSCRNGTCRTCMCQIKTGQVHYRIAWPGLSAEEKAEGWCLPCVAYSSTDLVILQPQALKLRVT
ncbi:2Fe-2S iron-sulfur cluster-binding protein [Rhodoferax sp.]|uniref:2Fe-2S iron-sulfur cluster-binding protein n=1 Tax=Rhodoferax sp. TaxID=50421 RepID=UPI002ACEE2A8|nr:2Fe-2S iron-sulfur cluster-binding protein [Rhodoferax sp.]MDZ7919351.1 2Fe-2S iron-sulfur cluster-binding protein [Rhodoferax sp.]